MKASTGRAGPTRRSRPAIVSQYLAAGIGLYVGLAGSIAGCLTTVAAAASDTTPQNSPAQRPM